MLRRMNCYRVHALDIAWTVFSITWNENTEARPQRKSVWQAEPTMYRVIEWRCTNTRMLHLVQKNSDESVEELRDIYGLGSFSLVSIRASVAFRN